MSTNSVNQTVGARIRDQVSHSTRACARDGPLELLVGRIGAVHKVFHLHDGVGAPVPVEGLIEPLQSHGHLARNFLGPCAQLSRQKQNRFPQQQAMVLMHADDDIRTLFAKDRRELSVHMQEGMLRAVSRRDDAGVVHCG